MDGYIKNIKKKIKASRQTIIYKCSLSIIIFLFVPVWLFCLVATQPPEKWTQTNIIYSEIRQERIGLRQHTDYVICADDGRIFIIQKPAKNLEMLEEKMVVGNQYSLVYSNTISGADIIKGLSYENDGIVDLETSVKANKTERKELVIAIFSTIGIGILSIIIIDRTWCKQDHEKITKLKTKINQRREIISKRV